jgi:hypothetical protein
MQRRPVIVGWSPLSTLLARPSIIRAILSQLLSQSRIGNFHPSDMAKADAEGGWFFSRAC